MTALRLDGRAAVVTGAGRGIGRAIAHALAALGASVVVNDLGGSNAGTGADRAPADAVVAELAAAGAKAIASYDSVADFESAGRIVRSALEAFGRLDILVNNAGISAGAPLWQLDPDLFERVVRVHLFGTYHCMRHAVEPMRANGWGRVVNIVSRAGLVGTPGSAAYAAGKGGIYGLTNAAAHDLAPLGITVNAVNPAATVTRMVTGAVERARERGLPSESAERMIAQAQAPEDVAPLVAFLCTEEAAGISGQTFFVQGGTVGLFPKLAPTQSATRDGRWTVEALAEAVARFTVPPLQPLY